MASMGPRSFNRGRHGTAPEVRLDVVLQWGLGLSTEEGAGRCNDRRTAKPASMGPRSFNRGRGNFRIEDGTLYKASMGPRSFNRGRDEQAAGQPAKKKELQWGLGLSTEEGKTHWDIIRALMLLQWGLGLSTEEG